MSASGSRNVGDVIPWSSAQITETPASSITRFIRIALPTLIPILLPGPRRTTLNSNASATWCSSDSSSGSPSDAVVDLPQVQQQLARPSRRDASPCSRSARPAQAVTTPCATGCRGAPGARRADPSSGIAASSAGRTAGSRQGRPARTPPDARPRSARARARRPRPPPRGRAPPPAPAWRPRCGSRSAASPAASRRPDRLGHAEVHVEVVPQPRPMRRVRARAPACASRTRPPRATAAPREASPATRPAPRPAPARAEAWCPGRSARSRSATPARRGPRNDSRFFIDLSPGTITVPLSDKYRQIVPRRQHAVMAGLGCHASV